MRRAVARRRRSGLRVVAVAAREVLRRGALQFDLCLLRVERVLGLRLLRCLLLLATTLVATGVAIVEPGRALAARCTVAAITTVVALATVRTLATLAATVVIGWFFLIAGALSLGAGLFGRGYDNCR